MGGDGVPVEHRSRRHHTVPRFYLRRFGVGNDLWAFDLDERRDFVTSVENLAVVRDFHTFTSPEGVGDDDLERILSVAEARQATAFGNLGAQWPPSEEVRAGLAYFAVLQFVRSTRWRAVSLGALGSVLKRLGQMEAGYARSHPAVREWFRMEFSSDDEPIGDAELDEVLEWWERGDYDVVVPDEHHMQQVAEALMDEKTIEQAMNRAWSLLHAPDGMEFVISDSPISLWSGQPIPAGIGNAEEVRVPIDRRRMLVMSFDAASEGKRRMITPQMLDHLNLGTALHAKRYLFGSPTVRRTGQAERVVALTYEAREQGG